MIGFLLKRLSPLLIIAVAIVGRAGCRKHIVVQIEGLVGHKCRGRPGMIESPFKLKKDHNLIGGWKTEDEPGRRVSHAFRM